MILEMDVGNSRCKWRLLGDGCIIRRGTLPLSAMHESAHWLEGLQPRRVRVASVAGPESRRWLAEALRQQTGVEAEFAVSAAQAGGIRNAYQDPARLGVDRWLALLAAWQRVQGAVVVVDAGTALTVDVVDGTGMHRGGYIMPGHCLLHGAVQKTCEVRYHQMAIPPSLLPAINTQDAVNRGTGLMLSAAADAAIGRCQALLGGVCPVLLCGGDAGIMQAHTAAHAEVVPDLVLDGLAVALP